MIWKPLQQPEADAISARLSFVLESWRGVRWKPGGYLRMPGVDCVRFVACVLDDLEHTSIAPTLPQLAQDIGKHQPDAAAIAADEMVRSWAPEFLRGDEVEPGDVIVTAGGKGGPAHALIVGPRPNTAWHCVPRSGVCCVGLGHIGMDAIGRALRIWRPLNKAVWV